MDDVTLLKPTLYRKEGTHEAPGSPALMGASCACGYVFFPLQTYGCERCGGGDPQPKALSGVGRLLASARVHTHARKGREAPFTVGSIQLDDGPIVRTLIEEAAGPLRIGMRMASTLVPVLDADGQECLDLRFAPEAQA